MSPFTKKPQDPDPGWTGPWMSTKSRICLSPVCSPAVGELGAGLEAGQASQMLFPVMWKVFGQKDVLSPWLHSVLVVASPSLRDAGFIIWWDFCIVMAFLKNKNSLQFMPVS